MSEIYELLNWFELELTDHKIVYRIHESYGRVHRFYMKVKKAIFRYEQQSIKLLNEGVEVDETYFGANFKNRKRKKKGKRKQGKIKRGRDLNEFKQAVFVIYECAHGIVYIKAVKEVTKATLQDVIKGKVSIETAIYSDTWKSYNWLK